MHMKSFISFLLIGVLLVTIGCTKNDEDLIQLDEQFTLAYQTDYALDNSNLHFQFVEVVEDSRCPLILFCHWAGQVIAKIRVIDDGDMVSEFELPAVGENNNNEEFTATYDNYRITLIKVTPYPEEDFDEIKDEDYKAILKVTPL